MKNFDRLRSWAYSFLKRVRAMLRIQETLEKTGWNQTRAAEQRGLSRQGLLKKMQRYGIG